MRKQINLLQNYAQIRCINDVIVSLGSGIFVQLRSVLLYEIVSVFVLEIQDDPGTSVSGQMGGVNRTTI